MIDELHAHGLVRITLPPLPADSIATLSAQLWPGLPSAERDQLQAQIMAATGGNPLLEVELLRELAAHAAPPHTLPLPSSVRDLVVRRMGRLAAAARPVIEALAVLDNPSAIVQLSQISACTIDETAHALDTGMRLGLLHERHTTGQTRYNIAHGLLRAAILDDLSAVRRQLLHRRTASVLAAAAERDQGHEQSGLFGRIMRHAEAGDAPELIIVWALPAAQHATSVYAFSEAKAFLEAGIAAYPRIAQPDHKRAMERHSIALLLHLAMLHETLVSPVTVVADLLAQARALITRRHDDRLWALFYRCEALELNLRGRFSAIPPVIQRGYAAARRAGDLQLAATCLNALASAYITTSQNRVGAAAYQQALQLWQRLGDTAGERRALIGLSLTELNYGQVQTAIDRLEQVLAIERQRGDQHGQAYCCYALAYAWGFFFHGEHVSAYAEQAIALYTQLGLSQGQARATLFLGFAHEIAGDWAAAEGLYRACWQTAVASDDIWLIGWSSHLIGRMRLLRGDLEDAEQWLHDAYALRLRSDQVQNQVVDRGWLAQLALAQNDPEDALDHSLAAVRLLEEANSEFYAWDPGIYLSHARALAAVGDRPAAAVFVERAEAALRSGSDQIRAPEVRRIFFNGFFARHIEQVQREIGNEWSC
jgi:tetratricopeptide (TPR) repeat protein